MRKRGTVFKQGSAQSCHHLGNKNAVFALNAMKKGGARLYRIKLFMDQNESEYGPMLLLLYPRYSCGYSYVFGCSAHALLNHFWSRHTCSLSTKEAI